MIDQVPFPVESKSHKALSPRFGEFSAKGPIHASGIPQSLRSTLMGEDIEVDSTVSKPTAAPSHITNKFLDLRRPPLSTLSSGSSVPSTPSVASTASSQSREPVTPPIPSPMVSVPFVDTGGEQSEASSTLHRASSSPRQVLSTQAAPDTKMREGTWPRLELRSPEMTGNLSPHSDPLRKLDRAGGASGSTLPSLSHKLSGERLPGIASLDEHMGTSWHAGLAARRREEGSDSRSPFSPTASVFGERSDAPSGSHHERQFQRRGTATEPMSPRMSSYKSELPTFEGSKQTTLQRDLSPMGRVEPNERNYEKYPASPEFAHPSSFSRRSTLRDDDEHAARWGREGRLSMASSRPHPDDVHDYRAPANYGSSFRTRSLGNWKVGSDEGAFRRDSYRMGAPPPIARGSAPTVMKEYDPRHRSPGSSAQYDVRMYDSGDERSLHEDNVRSSPRHHPYAMHGQAIPSGAAAADASGVDGEVPSAARRRGKLPKPVTDLLKTWLLEHASHPYPTEDEKKRLCDATGLTISQVSNWFINARRRILVPTGSGSFGVNAAASAGGAPMPSQMGPHGASPSHAPVDPRYAPSRYSAIPAGHAPPHHYSAASAAAYERDAYYAQRHPSWHSEPAPRYSTDARMMPHPGPSQYTYERSSH